MSSVRIIRAGKTEQFSAKSDENLLEVLRRNGVSVTAPCGGNGTCGKCRVTVRTENGEESVLACRTTVTGDCEVLLEESPEDGVICTDGGAIPVHADGRSGLGAAVDLGTTTVAVKLFDLADGTELGSEFIRSGMTRLGITEEEAKAYLATIEGVALGSDAFFPFFDNIERAKKSGVSYIAQPGGSIRDDLVIDCCNKYGMAMAFTGMRLFHH